MQLRGDSNQTNAQKHERLVEAHAHCAGRLVSPAEEVVTMLGQPQYTPTYSCMIIVHKVHVLQWCIVVWSVKRIGLASRLEGRRLLSGNRCSRQSC